MILHALLASIFAAHANIVAGQLKIISSSLTM